MEQKRKSGTTTTGRCLCGAVGWRFDGAIPDATICNCTACRRYGVLWAYDFDGHGIHIDDSRQMLTAYVKEGGVLSFNFCRGCGNLVSWRALWPGPDGRSRIAVNLRLADPADVADVPLQCFEGLHTFEDLPRDGRRVADVWF